MFAPGDVEYMPPLRDATTASTGIFSTPDDLLNAAQQTNAYVAALAAAVRAKSDWSSVPAGTGAALQSFLDGWANFYASDFSSRARVLLHWGTSDLQSTLANYQQQAADWGVKLKKYGAKIDAISPASAPGGGKNVMMWIGIGAVTLVGLFMIGKLVHTVAFGDARLEEAEDEAMRLLEEKKRKRHDRSAFSIT